MPFIKGVKTAYNSPNTIRLQAVELDNTAIIHSYQDFPAVGLVNPAAAFTLQVPDYKNYLVQVLEFVPGNPVGNIIGSYVKDTRTECAVEKDDIEIKVGGGRVNLDPVAGATSVDIPGLAGQVYRIVERGYGPLIEGVEFNYLLTGGFELLGALTFVDGKDYNIEFFAPGLTASPDIIIKVGGVGLYDPAAGTTAYRNPNLKDIPGRVVQRGIGPNRQVFDAEIALHPDGGFDLINGLTFEEGDTWFYQPYPTVCNTTVTGSGSLVNGEVIIANDTVYNINHRNKIILFRGAGNKVQYELPDIETLPDFFTMDFEAGNGAQVYGTIKTFGTQVIDCVVPNQVTTTKLYVAKGERCVLMKGGTTGNYKWRVLHMPEGYAQLGEDVVSTGYVKNALPKHGQTLDKTVYARLWDWLQANMATVKIVSDAVWNATTSKTNPLTGVPFNVKLNAGKVADVDANTFRLPDERSYYWRNEDDTAGGGASIAEIVWDDNQAHSHIKVDAPTGRIFDLLLTDDDSGSSPVTAISKDITAGEPNIQTGRSMSVAGGEQVLVRSINKIAQIKI